jgi:mRNA interferase RelE/StbE
MAAYEVEFATSAAKEFRSLPLEFRRRIAAAIDTLSEEPRPAGVRKLTGHRSLYRIRVGSYRVVYEIDDESKLIRITRVRHRREAYQ